VYILTGDQADTGSSRMTSLKTVSKPVSMVERLAKKFSSGLPEERRQAELVGGLVISEIIRLSGDGLRDRSGLANGNR